MKPDWVRTHRPLDWAISIGVQFASFASLPLAAAIMVHRGSLAATLGRPVCDLDGCQNCGYSRIGAIADRCPECGQPWDCATRSAP